MALEPNYIHRTATARWIKDIRVSPTGSVRFEVRRDNSGIRIMTEGGSVLVPHDAAEWLAEAVAGAAAWQDGDEDGDDV